ncbi:MAG: hypothetical protein HYZ00_04365 [Candidatus Hydrogenedentes bacterium]|nr:hypothetical protein [Candidatus Hydrogenedentota bacterium]
MPHHKRLTLILALAVTLAAAMPGCGKAKEEITEKAIEASINAGDKNVNVELGGKEGQFNMTAKTEEGTVNMSVGENAQLPKDWPQDVPIYTGLKVQVAQSMAEQGNFTVSGTIEAAVAKVSEFYKAETQKQGWTPMQTFTQPGMESCVYQKGDRMVTISMTGEGETTTLTLNTVKQ